MHVYQKTRFVQILLVSLTISIFIIASNVKPVYGSGCENNNDLFVESEQSTEDLILEDIDLSLVTLNTTLWNITLSNQTSYWLMEDITENNILYFNFRFLDLVLDYNISFYVKDNDDYASLLLEDRISVENDTYEIAGHVIADLAGDYIISVNTSIDLGISDRYSVEFRQSNIGFNYETAISLELGTTNVEAYVRQQLFYWKIYLDSNQRAELNITEIATDTLESSNVIIYNRPDDSLIKTNASNGRIYATWKRLESSTTAIFYAVLSRSFSSPLGNFSITLSTQAKAYNSNNAIEITVNETHVAEVFYIDQFQEETYFSIFIEYPGVFVDFWLEEEESDSNILEDASLYMYNEETNSIILDVHERNSFKDGTISGSFRASYSGYYYFKILPSNVGAPSTASYSIRFEYLVPGTYQWHTTEILINLVFLAFIPLLCLIERKYVLFKANRNTFSVNFPLEKVFRRFTNNPRFSKVKAVLDKHLIVEQDSLAGGFRMDFLHFDEETSIDVRRNVRKIEVFGSITVIWLIYSVLNMVYFSQSYRSFFPLEIGSTIDLIVLQFIIFVIPLLLYMMITVYPYIVFKGFTKEIEITLNEIERQNINDHVVPTINAEFIQRNMNYIRVLWNQAKKSFNKKDYGTFLIKADSSVKKLVELRYLQLYTSKDPDKKMETLTFSQIISAIRDNGFDIPPDRKIEHYRRLRNKVVHGSLLPDEEAIIDTFSFYAKFLGRLGLRI